MHTSAHDAGELAYDSGNPDCDLGILDAIDISPGDYLLAQVPLSDRDPGYRPIANHAYFEEANHLQLKIQPFKNGGYEGTVRWVDAQKIADMQNMPRKIGKRKKPEERSQESLERSRNRARQKVRHHAKILPRIGCSLSPSAKMQKPDFQPRMIGRNIGRVSVVSIRNIFQSSRSCSLPCWSNTKTANIIICTLPPTRSRKCRLRSCGASGGAFVAGAVWAMWTCDISASMGITARHE